MPVTDGVATGTTETETIRVMIVDDHPMVRVGLRALLDVPSVSVVAEASSAAEAAALAAEHQPDVVLMDIRMPDGDGLTATTVLRKVSPESRILIVTSFDDRDYLRSAIAAGASGFLLKQASRALLLDSIRTVHAGGSTFPLDMMGDLLTGARAQTRTARTTADGVIRIGSLVIDPERHHVTVEGRSVVLTYLEFRALVALAHSPDIVSYAQLQRAIWPEEPEDADPHRIVSLIARLRSRLGTARSYLRTVKRVGYHLSPPEA